MDDFSAINMEPKNHPIENATLLNHPPPFWVAVGTYSRSIDVAPLLMRHFFQKANHVRIRQTTFFFKT